MLGWCCLDSLLTDTAAAGAGTFFPKIFFRNVNNIVDIDLVLLLRSPFTYNRLVSLALPVVAFITERLKVATVEESLDTTDGPRNYVVNTSCLLDDASLLTFLAELVTRGIPEGLREPCPPSGVV